MIKIVLNGEEKNVPPGGSLSDLLRYLGVAGDQVAIELNRAIVKRAEWSSTGVSDGARLEIVQFVGGG